MVTVFKDSDREALLSRFTRLKRDQAPLWGTLTAPEMVVHLADQLRMALGDVTCDPIPGVWHNPIFKAAFLYLPSRMLWVKNQKRPPEAFATQPETWEKAIDTLLELMERLVARMHAGDWPDHPNLGTMTRHGWGVFTYRHFDHHLRQFGV